MPSFASLRPSLCKDVRCDLQVIAHVPLICHLQLTGLYAPTEPVFLNYSCKSLFYQSKIIVLFVSSTSFVILVQLRVSIPRKWKVKLSSMIVNFSNSHVIFKYILNHFIKCGTLLNCSTFLLNCSFYHNTVTWKTARPYTVFGGLI